MPGENPEETGVPGENPRSQVPVKLFPPSIRICVPWKMKSAGSLFEFTLFPSIHNCASADASLQDTPTNLQPKAFSAEVPVSNWPFEFAFFNVSVLP